MNKRLKEGEYMKVRVHELAKKYDIKNVRKINFEINEEKEYAELSESKKKLYDYFTKTTK